MELKVNHGALDGASGDLASGGANIQSAPDTMDAELQQLKANWEGDAQMAYQDAKARWTEGMNGMRQVLLTSPAWSPKPTARTAPPIVTAPAGSPSDTENPGREGGRTS